MTDATAKADSTTAAPAETETAATAHVMVIGDKSFPCRAKRMPYGTLLKFSKSGWTSETFRGLIVALLKPADEDELEPVWDAIDEVGQAEGQKAILEAANTYMATDDAENEKKRPT